MKQKALLSAPALEKKEVAAVQAVYQGVASEHQQKLAMDVILKKICQLGDEPFRSDERETSFALGRANVARQLLKLIETPLGNMK